VVSADRGKDIRPQGLHLVRRSVSDLVIFDGRLMMVMLVVMVLDEETQVGCWMQ
jgi:hypothetical protein